jgi:hypothetical protein
VWLPQALNTHVERKHTSGEFSKMALVIEGQEIIWHKRICKASRKLDIPVKKEKQFW